MKQSIIKKIICAVLAATLIFGAAPAAMAQTPTAIVAQAETEAHESNDFVTLADEGEKDDDIRDNQTFQEALVEIVKSFVKAFAETIVRYVKFIIDFINSQIGQQ